MLAIIITMKWQSHTSDMKTKMPYEQRLIQAEKKLTAKFYHKVHGRNRKLKEPYCSTQCQESCLDKWLSFS